MSARKKAPERNQQTTISIKPSVRKKFQELVGNRHVSARVEEFMIRTIDPARAMVSDVNIEDESAMTEILASMVAESITRNREWAREAARRAHLQLPSGMILRERTFKHYMKDKQHLARLFGEWLAKRLEYWLEQRVNIALFLDAGSAVLWLATEFWPHLSRIAKAEKWLNNSINIYTNNLAVAERYVRECEEKRIVRSRVSCELLGGVIDPRYAALTGQTVTDRIKALSASDSKHIAILAGNYIRVHTGATEVTSVRPLVRGDGQRAVKSLFAKADETYILGCIGKLWTGTTDQINVALDKRGSTGSYEEVWAPDHSAARLVTTIRTLPTAILRDHSNSVHGMLGVPLQPKLETAQGDFNSVPHFCYSYDEPIKNLAVDEQLKVEFPHDEERTPEFWLYYGVKI